MTNADKKAHLAKLHLVHVAMTRYARTISTGHMAVVDKSNSEPKPGQPVWPMGVTAYPK